MSNYPDGETPIQEKCPFPKVELFSKEPYLNI